MTDEQFNDAEPFEIARTYSESPLVAYVTCGTRRFVTIEACDLYAHEARALRDWLNEVLP